MTVNTTRSVSKLTTLLSHLSERASEFLDLNTKNFSAKIKLKTTDNTKIITNQTINKLLWLSDEK